MTSQWALVVLRTSWGRKNTFSRRRRNWEVLRTSLLLRRKDVPDRPTGDLNLLYVSPGLSWDVSKTSLQRVLGTSYMDLRET